MIDLNNIPEQVQSGKFRIPRNNYGLRIVDAELGKSFMKQTPFLRLQCEVCTPDTVPIGSKQVKIAGIKATLTYWLTDKALSRLVDFHNKLGITNDPIPTEDEVAGKEYCTRYLGHGLNGIVVSKEKAEQKEVIDDEGNITREELLDENGKKIINYSYEVDQVLSPNLSLKVNC